MIKAVLLDFDGTLVTKDMLDVVCGIVGKEEESKQINQDFHAGKRGGISGLIERINFLKGVSLSQIRQTISANPYFMPGAHELMDFMNSHHLISVLHSGNIVPILETYQKLLGITYVIGTRPTMNGETIEGFSSENAPKPGFKLTGVDKILKELNIHADETIAIGDSPADKPIFEFAKYSIAINPKGGVEQYATYVIKDDLTAAISIIEGLL